MMVTDLMRELIEARADHRVDEILKHLSQNGFRFRELIYAIVVSEPFLFREAKRGAE